MQMFSRFCVYVFLGVALLYAGGTMDVHAQQASLTFDGSTGGGRVYAVGDTVEAVFTASFDGLPVSDVVLIITHGGLTGVTISNGGTTNAFGSVTVSGTIAGDTDVYIQAEWQAERLTARAGLDVVDESAEEDALEDAFLKVIGSTGFDPNATVGTELTVVFQAGYSDVGEQRIPLRITASPNINITSPTPVPETHMTGVAGLLIVRGTLLPTADPDFYIQVEWENRGLIAQVQPPREPRQLTIVSGDLQVGAPQTALGNPLVVLVRDQYGNALSGVDVTFRVTKGDGNLSRPRVQTHNTGRAETTLTLASDGIHQVEASVIGFPSLTQTFTAAAAACEVPPPSRATTLRIVSGNHQWGMAGESLVQPFVVGVLDQAGKPLQGIPVTFTITAGDGRLSVTRQSTDVYGQARTTLTLGTGEHLVRARVAGITQTQTFTADAWDVGEAPSISQAVSVENTLLANYPNPFNPETWIPYQLSAAADVSVSIYSVNGHLVRRLDLGHQSAGVYRSRRRAAYWDGRNAFGERVASGLYFYTLTAGDFTATRKMLIRK